MLKKVLSVAKRFSDQVHESYDTRRSVQPSHKAWAKYIVVKKTIRDHRDHCSATGKRTRADMSAEVRFRILDASGP